MFIKIRYIWEGSYEIICDYTDYWYDFCPLAYPTWIKCGYVCTKENKNINLGLYLCG